VTDYATLLRTTFLAEARAEGFYKTLARTQPDADRRQKLETLQTIEARTLTSMRRLLEQVGLRVDPESARRRGRELALQADPTDWSAFVKALGQTTEHDDAAYETLQAAAPHPKDPALVALVNHARALDRFVELETAGERKQSLRALTDYLRRPA
jgi:rubrerythrin